MVYGFTKTLLAHRFDGAVPTPDFHRELWDLCCDKHPYVAAAAPRGHAKSTCISFSYLLAEVLFRRSDYVILISDTEPQAIQFLNDIKIELQENEQLRALFQVNGFTKENEKDIIVNIGPDKHEFRITAKSSGQSLRGMKWKRKRPNLIIGDDLENDEIVLNQERRLKFKSWFFGALLPTLSDYGRVRIIGTILHFDSLLENLMPPLSGDKSVYTRVEGLKTYSVDPEMVWKSYKWRAHTGMNDFTEILWPEKFNKTRLTLIRQSYIEQGFPEGYSQEYLNYPIDESSAFFRREDLVPMRDVDRTSHKIFYAAVDMAVSTKQKADYTVIVVAGMDDEGFLNVVDVRRGRWDSKQIIEEMMNVQIRYQPALFIMEKGPLEKAIGPFLKDEMLKRNRPFINLYPMPALTDKRSRARSIQGRMRQGGVRFDVSASWYLELEEELLRFDRGTHDDQVDALSWIGLALKDLEVAPNQEERDELEYEQEVLKEPESIYYGRSSYTGY